MRELSQIDEELRQVRRDLDRAKKLDAMLSNLGKQHLRRRQAAAEAFAALNRAEEKEAFLESGREAEHAAGLVNYYQGHRLVLINKSTTPYDKNADLVLSGPIGEILDQIRV